MILRRGYGLENGLVRKRGGRETAGFPSPSSFEAILIALETQTEIIKKSLNTYLRNCLPFFYISVMRIFIEISVYRFIYVGCSRR